MKKSEFEILVAEATIEETQDLMVRARGIFNQEGLADIKTVCAFLLSEIPQTSSAICKRIIERSGLLSFEPEN